MSPDEHRPSSLHSAAAPAAEDDLGFVLPEPAKPGKGRIVLLLALAAAVVASGFVIGYLPRVKHDQGLARAAEDNTDATPSVDVVQPKLMESTRPATLTASLMPLEDTILYPRANGYVEQWYKDIGDEVQAGTLLALIETPELDQQLDQAKAELLRVRAALLQAQTQAEYAKTSLTRYERLRPAGVASQQELEQHTAESHVADANVAAAKANIEVNKADLRRLSQLKSFSRVVAPFAGTITQRSVERGALVTGATPLFRLASNHTLRAFVQVPQDLAVRIHPGSKAEISLREYPGRSFEGTLTRSAGALDPATRTLTTEIRIDNSKHELLAGMYAQATLAGSQSHTVYEIPATALWNDANGLRVALVDRDDTLHFRTITLERDAGAVLQISSGLKAEDRVVKLATASLAEGDKVRVRAQKPQEQAQATQPSKKD